MSNLSVFFTRAGGGSVGTTAINLIMVGGGGGGGAGTVCTACPGTGSSDTNNAYSGAGGGGYFYGRVCIEPGVSYPVVIGTGGSPGTPTSCATESGLGNPGSPSKFGRYEALGGGGGATICGGSPAATGTFGISGAPGGHGGSISRFQNSIPCGPCNPPQCGSYNDRMRFSVTGANQRTPNLNGYCGAHGQRIESAGAGSPTQGCSYFGTRTCINPGAGLRVCPEFFGVCLASVPYDLNPSPYLQCMSCAWVVTIRAGCSRTIINGPNKPINWICNFANTGFGARTPCCNGDSGVVLVAYPCALPAATSFPGGVDCSPVSIPQNNMRTYKFTTSGSFTL